MLRIKLIQVEGGYKALVLDMSKLSERLVYLAEGSNLDAVEAEAKEFVEMKSKGVMCH